MEHTNGIISKLNHYKELEIILSDFTCDKNCPYCTAKITKWPSVFDNIEKLRDSVNKLKKDGYTFDFVTIGGNGEPTLHNYDKLKTIVDMFKDYSGVGLKRVLTSGNVFRDEQVDIFNLFNDNGWVFEVTLTNPNQSKDNEVLGYDFEYLTSENFSKAHHIRANIVALKDNVLNLSNYICTMLDTYDNIHTVGIKLLNINTKTNLIDNKLSEWIYKNGVPKTDADDVIRLLDNKYGSHTLKYDIFSWVYNNTANKNREVYFSSKKAKYGYKDLVWYGDRFVDYSLNTVNPVTNVYIAAHFNKSSIPDGVPKFSLEEDFRDKAIKANNPNLGLMDYTENAFIIINGSKLRYVGPFYNEKASSGKLTSTDCVEVVNTEKALIDECDIFIAHLNNDVSPGSISELIYAAMKGKKIVIFYDVEEIVYSLKSTNWFPIIMTMQLTEDVELIPITSYDKLTDYFC